MFFKKPSYLSFNALIQRYFAGDNKSQTGKIKWKKNNKNNN